MSLLQKRCNLLVQRCESKLQVCEVKLNHLERMRKDLNTRHQQIFLNKHALRMAIDSDRYEGLINLTGLLMRQRQLAVLRRNIVDLNLEESDVSEKLKQCLSDEAVVIAERRLLLRKKEKYNFVITLERDNKNLVNSRFMDLEIEEFILWKK